MRYGVGYLGSKNAIAEKILGILPAGRRLVDIFAGGCAITHCGIVSGKYQCFLMMDISDNPMLFLNAIQGKYKDEKRWISREDFDRLKDTDLYVRIAFSFGNNGRTYLYARDLEPYKRACHFAVCFDNWTDYEQLCPETAEAAKEAVAGISDLHTRRIRMQYAIFRWLKENGTPEIIEGNRLYRTCKGFRRKNVEGVQMSNNIECLERLHGIEALQNLEILERLDGLNAIAGKSDIIEFLQKSYDEYVYEDGDVVYCDPPYITKNCNESDYGAEGRYDKEAFCEWVRTRPFPVFISEYSMPDDFYCIKRFMKQNKLSSKGSQTKFDEGLFIHKKWKDVASYNIQLELF